MANLLARFSLSFNEILDYNCFAYLSSLSHLFTAAFIKRWPKENYKQSKFMCSTRAIR